MNTVERLKEIRAESESPHELDALIADLEREVLAEGAGYFGADCLSGDTCIDYLSLEPFYATDIPVHVTITRRDGQAI